MKNYEELFKELLKSYEEDKLEKKIKDILKQKDINKEEFSKVISSLCGVEVDYENEESFIKKLNKAIKENNTGNKIIKKVKECTGECKDETGKTKCERACPFNAIIKDNGKIEIDEEVCVDCGKCVNVCGEGGIIDKIEIIPLLEILKSGKLVIAAVAPAIAGQFGEDVNLNKLRAAFKEIGFTDMIEVAFFADMLTLKEAIEYDHFVKNENDIMITSCCCPMWVGMLKKVYKDLVKNVSPSVSPMIAAGRVIKKLNPECKVVFVGPCIAKKAEAKNEDIKDAIDFVLTFEEVKTIFDTLEIEPSKMKEDETAEYASREGRLYARTGGVSIAVSEAVDTIFPERKGQLKSVQANGVKECKELLDKVTKGEVKANFVEGMGCIGGCVGGPKALIDRKKGKEFVDEVAENSEVKISLYNKCMKEILKRIGINSVEDFKDEEKIKIFERKF